MSSRSWQSRRSSLASASALCRPSRGLSSGLAEGTFIITGTTTAPATNNTCAIGADGTDFFTFGTVQGVGTGGQVISIQYDAPEPTSVSRNTKKIAVKEGTFSQLRRLVALEAPALSTRPP